MGKFWKDIHQNVNSGYLGGKILEILNVICFCLLEFSKVTTISSMNIITCAIKKIKNKKSRTHRGLLSFSF